MGEIDEKGQAPAKAVSEEPPRVIHAWDLDPKHPVNFSRWKKTRIVFLVALAQFLSPISSTAYYPALVTIGEYFNTTPTIVNLTVALFLLGNGIFPLAWAPLSEVLGRRPIYLISLVIAAAASVLCGLSRNVWMLLVMRLLACVGSSAAQAVGAGTISDCFLPKERGKAMGAYMLGLLIGPLIGPLIGGYLAQYLGWQSIFFFLAILAAVIFILVFLFLPETFRNDTINDGGQLTTNTPRAIPWSEKFRLARQELGLKSLLHSLHYFKDPSITLIMLNTGLLFGGWSATSTTSPRILQGQYKLTESLTGVASLSAGFGNIVGSLCGGSYTDYVLRLAKKRKGRLYPEMRLLAVTAGGVLYPLGMVAYGWTIEYDVNLAAPLVVWGIAGLGMTLDYLPCSAYMVDAIPGKSASTMAFSNLGRCVLQFLFALIGVAALDSMGAGGFFTFIACLILVGNIMCVVVYRYGPSWREKLHGDKPETDYN